MERRWPPPIQPKRAGDLYTGPRDEDTGLSDTKVQFQAHVAALFEAHFQRLHRYMHRLSGEPELAADVVQEAFVKLFQRGALPQEPAAWLISVSMNLFRNEKGKRSRRLRLLTPERGERSLGDAPPSPDAGTAADDSRRNVRAALERLPERDRQMLLLHGEGYRYREIALALEMNEASVGTLLARARRAFREAYEELTRAS